MTARKDTPSATQMEVFRHLLDEPKLVRMRGGFWTVPNLAQPYGAPKWWVGTQTVAAMEARGWLIVDETGAQGMRWACPRRLTELGREVYARATNPTTQESP